MYSTVNLGSLCRNASSLQAWLSDYVHFPVLLALTVTAKHVRSNHTGESLCRSDSAHALGISIDPEMLPDIDALTDPFELPAQLRDTAQQPAAPQPQQPHSSYPAGQPREQHHHDTQSHQPYGNTSPSVASGLLNTGATASSGPASTASDDSGNPNLKAGRAAAKQTTPDLFDDLHLAYNQSGSLPLLDVDVDALTDQQAAYMLDVSPLLLLSCLLCVAESKSMCMSARCSQCGSSKVAKLVKSPALDLELCWVSCTSAYAGLWQCNCIILV